MDGRSAYAPRPAAAGPADADTVVPPGCGMVFTPDQAEALLQRVKKLATGGCRLLGQRTVRERTAVRWQDGQGEEALAIIVPKACLFRGDDVDTEGGEVALLVSAEAAGRCPEAVESLRVLVRRGKIPAPLRLSP